MGQEGTAGVLQLECRNPPRRQEASQRDAHQLQGWEGAVGGLEGVSTMAALGEGHQTQLLAFVKDDNELLHVLGAFTYLHALRGGPRKGEKKDPSLSFPFYSFTSGFQIEEREPRLRRQRAAPQSILETFQKFSLESPRRGRYKFSKKEKRLMSEW